MSSRWGIGGVFQSDRYCVFLMIERTPKLTRTDTLFPYTTLFRSAYRAGVEITDERTGLVHDYTRKQGVEHSELMLPTDAPEWAADRERLWNAAELAETRKNATVAREYEIALPVELSADERRELALG